ACRASGRKVQDPAGLSAGRPATPLCGPPKAISRGAQLGTRPSAYGEPTAIAKIVGASTRTFPESWLQASATRCLPGATGSRLTSVRAKPLVAAPEPLSFASSPGAVPVPSDR